MELKQHVNSKCSQQVSWLASLNDNSTAVKTFHVLNTFRTSCAKSGEREGIYDYTTTKHSATHCRCSLYTIIQPDF